jgi:YesN/AraC family two-component response regulator
MFDSFFNQEIDSVYNGEEGISTMIEKGKKCCGNPYKLVIVDFNMPVLGGCDMMKQVKEMIKTN